MEYVLLTISGGILTGAGNKTAHTLNLSSGSITGTGNLTVTNAYSQTGGTVNIGGVATITQQTGNLALGAITAAQINATALAGSLLVNGLLSAAGPIDLAAYGATSDLSVTGAGGVSGSGGDISLTAGQDIVHGSNALQINNASGGSISS